MDRFADYEYDFKYRPGSQNKNADALSRNPPEENSVSPLRIAMIRGSKTGNRQRAETLGEEPARAKRGRPSNAEKAKKLVAAAHLQPKWDHPEGLGVYKNTRSKKPPDNSQISMPFTSRSGDVIQSRPISGSYSGIKSKIDTNLVKL